MGIQKYKTQTEDKHFAMIVAQKVNFVRTIDLLHVYLWRRILHSQAISTLYSFSKTLNKRFRLLLLDDCQWGLACVSKQIWIRVSHSHFYEGKKSDVISQT